MTAAAFSIFSLLNKVGESVWSGSLGKIGDVVTMLLMGGSTTYKPRQFSPDHPAVVYDIHKGTGFVVGISGPQKSGHRRARNRLPKSSILLLTKLAIACNKQVVLKSVYPH